MAKITLHRAALSGSKQPELQLSAPEFAHPPHAVTSDNAYLYEQIPRGTPAYIHGDPGEDDFGGLPEKRALRGLIVVLAADFFQRRAARFQRTDAAEFAARTAELDAASEQNEPIPLLADISLPTLQVGSAPWLEAEGNSVLHRLWRLSPGSRDEVRSLLSNCEFTVAGGEGLCDALLHYHASRLQTPSGRGVLALVIPREHGPEILQPVHRVVRKLPAFQTGEMVRIVRENFFFEDVTRSMPRLGGSGPHFDPGTAKALLKPLHPGEVTMLAITAHSSFRLHSEAGWADTVLAHLNPRLREYDSVQLHEIILYRRLGVPCRTRHDGIQEASDHLVYESNMTAAVRAVAEGANVAFLMNAPNLAGVLDIASRGELLPARSAQIDLGLQGLLKYAAAD